MEEVGKANGILKKAVPSARTTAVMMPMDYIAAAKMVDLDYFTMDIYPFFSAKNPNGPGDHAASTWYYAQACQRANEVHTSTACGKNIRSAASFRTQPLHFAAAV